MRLKFIISQLCEGCSFLLKEGTERPGFFEERGGWVDLSPDWDGGFTHPDYGRHPVFDSETGMGLLRRVHHRDICSYHPDAREYSRSLFEDIICRRGEAIRALEEATSDRDAVAAANAFWSMVKSGIFD